MKNQALLLFVLLSLTLLLTSCDQENIRASGDVTVQSYHFSDFSALDICCDMKAFVTFSDTEERIEIEADDNLHEHMVVELSGNTLVVRIKDNVNIRGNETMNVYIVTAALDALEGTGDAEIELQNTLATKRLKIELAGDSQFSGDLEVNSLDIELVGDSEVRLTGTTNVLEADLAGDSKISDFDFEVGELDIELVGDSEAYLTVTREIDIEATGDSKLVYKGDAVVTRERITGDSEIIKVD